MLIEKMTVTIPYNSAREIMQVLDVGLTMAHGNITKDAQSDCETLLSDIRHELELYQKVLEDRNGL